MKTLKNVFTPVPKNAARLIINVDGKQVILQTTGRTEFLMFKAVANYKATVSRVKRVAIPRVAAEPAMDLTP